MLGQVLSHRISLVIGPDLLFMTVDSCMRREPRFSSIPHLANVADPGVIGAGPQMTRARAGHAAVREQTPGEVGAGQEGAKTGATLLHHLDPEPDPFVVDAFGQPPVRRGWVEGSE